MADNGDLPRDTRRRRKAGVLERIALPAGLVAAGLTTAISASWGFYSPVLGTESLRPFDDGIRFSRPATLIEPLALSLALVLVWRFRRAWPLLLVTGTLLLLPALTVAQRTMDLSPRTSSALTHAFGAGIALVIVSVLTAAQSLDTEHLVNDRRPRSVGAGVSAVVIAAPWIGTAIIGAAWLQQTQDLPTIHLAIAVLGVAGAVTALLSARRQRRSGRGRNRGRGPDRVRPRIHVLIAGVLAAFVPFFLPYLTEPRLAQVAGVSVDSLERRPYAVVAIAGLLVLAVAGVLTLACGVSASVGTITVATIEVGAVAPMLLGVYASAAPGRAAMLAAVTGLAAGVIVAVSRWRALAAALAALGCAAAVMVATVATGGEPEKVIDQEARLPGLLLVAVIVFLVATTVATATPLIAARGGLAVLLGALLPLLFLGGKGALTLTQVTEGRPESSALNGIRHLESSAALLVLGAVLLAGIGLFESRRLVLRDEPGAPPTPAPVERPGTFFGDPT